MAIEAVLRKDGVNGRGNLDNLIPNEQRTPEERRRNASKAGKASGKKRRQLRDWKEVASAVLSLPVKEGAIDKRIKSIAGVKGKNIDAQTAIIMAQVVQAIKGNPKSAQLLLELTNVTPIGDAIEQPTIIDDIGGNEDG